MIISISDWNANLELETDAEKWNIRNYSLDEKKSWQEDLCVLIVFFLITPSLAPVLQYSDVQH